VNRLDSHSVAPPRLPSFSLLPLALSLPLPFPPRNRLSSVPFWCPPVALAPTTSPRKMPACLNTLNSGASCRRRGRVGQKYNSDL
jgi:hypothetical protein